MLPFSFKKRLSTRPTNRRAEENRKSEEETVPFYANLRTANATTMTRNVRKCASSVLSRSWWATRNFFSPGEGCEEFFGTSAGKLARMTNRAPTSPSLPAALSNQVSTPPALPLPSWPAFSFPSEGRGQEAADETP